MRDVQICLESGETTSAPEPSGHGRTRLHLSGSAVWAPRDDETSLAFVGQSSVLLLRGWRWRAVKPGDARHVAVASFHRCGSPVTWNCKHLANANKFGHIRRVNTLLGLYVPALVTPLELQERDDE